MGQKMKKFPSIYGSGNLIAAFIKALTPDHILCSFNPVRKVTPDIFNIHFSNIILYTAASSKWPNPFSF